MSTSTRDITSKPKRPSQTGTPVLVRVQPDLLADLDAWIAEQPDPKPSRPEAMRALVADYLITLGLRKLR